MQANGDAGATRFSLRSRFAWTLAGNVLYSLSQWLVLSLIAKLGGAEMLGQFALAVAIAGPIAMLAHLNLRSVIVTDLEARHATGDYLGFRLWTSALGLAAIAAIAVAANQPPPVTAAILLVGVALSAEAVSDVYYAFLQRREQMDRIALSMIARGYLSAAALALALWLTRSLAVAAAAFAAGRVLMLLAVDCRLPGDAVRRSPIRVRWHADVLRNAWPLGVVLMLGSFSTNIPRYLIERYIGIRELGAFAAVASFIAVGNTIVHALGQAAAPRLARAAGAGDRGSFARLAVRLGGLAVLLGAAGAVTAALIGRWALTLFYRPEFAAYRDLLILVMGASGFAYLAVTLGHLLTSARLFTAQIPLLTLACLTVAAVNWMLLPRYGLAGAAAGIAAAGIVQSLGALWLLAGLFRRMRRSV